MTLSNNYKFDDNSSGWPLRFIYLATDSRLQAYLGRISPSTGQFEPEHQYLDEARVTAATRKELHALAFAFAESAETPDDMEFNAGGAG